MSLATSARETEVQDRRELRGHEGSGRGWEGTRGPETQSWSGVSKGREAPSRQRSLRAEAEGEP